MAVRTISLGQKFQTLEELEAAIDAYSKEQKVPYVVYSSKSAIHFNEKQSQKGSAVRIAENLKWKEAVISCKHYGRPRFHRHKDGTQERPNQSTFKKFCPAKFNVNYSVEASCFVVTKLHDTHQNHPMLEHLSSNYPEFRTPPPEAQEEVESLLENEVKAHHIRSKVCSHGIKATRQDIQNMRNKWKKRRNGSKSPEDAVLEELQKLLQEDPGSTVVINHDDETMLINSIFFQTSSMKKAFSEYPEVLITDTTYKLCENDMPLVVYETIDCFGAGRIAGYAIIGSEKKEIVTEALKLLCMSDEEAFQKMSVVVIDKDLSEIAAIKEVAPNVEVHICDFHSKDAFEKAGKKKHGKGYMEDVHPIVCSMINAHTKEDFDEAYEALKTVATDSFLKYYHKNWHEKGLVWADYQRNASFNLKERTTGRIESHNGKIKIVICKKIPVAEVIFRLIVMNKFRDMDNDYKLYLAAAKTKYDKYSKDPVIQEIKRLNTPFVGKELQRQYERSKEPPSHNIHDVTCDSCDCKFFCNSRLPCSHIFRERSLQGEKVYDHDLIPSRWKVPLNQVHTEVNDSNVEGIIFLQPQTLKSPKRPKCLTSEEKYTECMKICTDICMKVANTGGRQFEYNLNALKCFQTQLKEGKKFAVVGVDENYNAQGVIYPTMSNQLEDEHGLAKEQSEDNIDKDDCSQNLLDGMGTKGTLESESQPHTVSKVASQSTSLAGEDNQSTDDKGNEADFTGGPGCSKATKSIFKKLDHSTIQSLKLPKSVPVKGRPRDNKKKGNQTWRKKKQTSSHELSDSDEVDDVVSVHPSSNEQTLVNKCSSCHTTAMIRTSFSKRNHGRKYFSCPNGKTAECRKYHAWVEDKAVGTLKTPCEKVETCVVTAHKFVRDPDSVIEDYSSENEPSQHKVIDDASCEIRHVNSNVATPERRSLKDLSNSPRAQHHAQENLGHTLKGCPSCNQEAVVRRSQTKANNGRLFYCCGNPIFEACENFFEWISKSNNTSPRVKQKRQSASPLPSLGPAKVQRVFGTNFQTSPTKSPDTGELWNFLSFSTDELWKRDLLDDCNNADLLRVMSEPYDTSCTSQHSVAKVVQTAVHTTAETAYISNHDEDSPLCFCELPTVRVCDVNSSGHKSRQYYKCTIKAADETKGCMFWRLTDGSPLHGKESDRNCTTCGKEAGNHSCITCRQVVHAIAPCSVPAPGSEEGFGQQRTCHKCDIGEDVKPLTKFNHPNSTQVEIITIVDSDEEVDSAEYRKATQKTAMRMTLVDHHPFKESTVDVLDSLESNKQLKVSNDPIPKRRVETIGGQNFRALSGTFQEAASTRNLQPSLNSHVGSKKNSATHKNSVERATDLLCPTSGAAMPSVSSSPGLLPYWKCMTCDNKDLQRRTITTPGKDFGREYVGCYADNCPREKPFLFWAPVSGKKSGHNAKSQLSGHSSSHPKGNTNSASSKAVKRTLFHPQEREITEEEMCLAVQLFQKQFPNIGGWDHPVVGAVSYEVAKAQDTVQIVFDPHRQHWVTVIIRKSLDGSSTTVYVYDSLRRVNGASNLTDSLKCRIAELCHEEKPAISVIYPACQQQEDKKMCGFFAVAFALDFCLTNRIRCKTYKVKEMQQHFEECLKKNKLSAFPPDPQTFKSPGRTSIKEIIQVFCSCRMPQEFDNKTIECEICSEWFHFKCVGLTESPGDWICSNCRDKSSDHSD